MSSFVVIGPDSLLRLAEAGLTIDIKPEAINRKNPDPAEPLVVIRRKTDEKAT